MILKVLCLQILISLDISIPETLAPRFEIDCDRSIFNIIVLSKDKIIM